MKWLKIKVGSHMKTSAIISEMVSTSQTGLQQLCKIALFVPLLAIPVFKGCSTAMNIYNLILNKLNQLNVPVLNCIAFASNAAVMKNLMFNF